MDWPVATSRLAKFKAETNSFVTLETVTIGVYVRRETTTAVHIFLSTKRSLLRKWACVPNTTRRLLKALTTLEWMNIPPVLRLVEDKKKGAA